MIRNLEASKDFYINIDSIIAFYINREQEKIYLDLAGCDPKAPRYVADFDSALGKYILFNLNGANYYLSGTEQLDFISSLIQNKLV